MLEGQSIDEVISKLEGISCGMKPTSCPDQLSKALKDVGFPADIEQLQEEEIVIWIAVALAP